MPIPSRPHQPSAILHQNVGRHFSIFLHEAKIYLQNKMSTNEGNIDLTFIVVTNSQRSEVKIMSFLLIFISFIQETVTLEAVAFSVNRYCKIFAFWLSFSITSAVCIFFYFANERTHRHKADKPPHQTFVLII